MLSAGSPVAGTVIASRLCQVSTAQRCSGGLGAAAARAWAAGLRPRAATEAAVPISSWRRAGVLEVRSDMVVLRSSVPPWGDPLMSGWCVSGSDRLLDASGGDALDDASLE